MEEMILTYKFRLRDKHAAELNRQAAAVNYVWNYCNETQRKAARNGRKWLNYHDLRRLTAGSCKMLDLYGQTVQQVCMQYDRSRSLHNKPWLRWRGRKSLGWVPFTKGRVRFDGDGFVFRGCRYEPMHLRSLPGGPLLASSFSQDARGRWYINACVDVDVMHSGSSAQVGIDLGLRTLAALSNGGSFAMPSFFRRSEGTLAVAHRAKKTRRARAIQVKAANRRRDFLHKASAKIAKEFGLIVVGDVSPSKLSQTHMAKSVYDAGWADFKRMLSYKAIGHGGRMLEVRENMTTRLCSNCNEVGGPKGIAQLGIREWTCSSCGSAHDRDVNSARNILRLGLQSLAEGAAQMRSSQFVEGGAPRAGNRNPLLCAYARLLKSHPS